MEKSRFSAKRKRKNNSSRDKRESESRVHGFNQPWSGQLDGGDPGTGGQEGGDSG